MTEHAPRWDRIRQLRQQIADGTYFTVDRLRDTTGQIIDELSRTPHELPVVDEFKTRPELDL